MSTDTKPAPIIPEAEFEQGLAALRELANGCEVLIHRRETPPALRPYIRTLAEHARGSILHFRQARGERIL